MWHVDEGMLHAYLDGALEEYPGSEARRVRDHLDACAACRERLSVERRIRDEAGSILGLAAPRVEMPTLEELRAYAQAGVARRAPMRGRLRWLGWAASLVLALGSGWMLRGGQRGAPVDPVANATRQQAAAVSRGPVDVAPPAEVAQAVPPREDAPSPIPSTSPERVAIAFEAPSADIPRDEAVLESLVPPALAPPALPEPAIVVAALDATPVQLETGAEDNRQDTASGRRSSPEAVVTSATASAPPTGLGFGRPASDTRDVVTGDDDSYSLVVPGLPVLDVRFRGSGTQPEGQVALQQLESGDTLQVIHLPLELDPVALEERAPGINELVMRRSAGWIVMRAPLDDARLMELMTRLLSGS